VNPAEIDKTALPYARRRFQMLELRGRSKTPSGSSLLSKVAVTKTTKTDYDSRKGAREEHCHFERREKSFLDPSHSLGMTGL